MRNTEFLEKVLKTGGNDNDKRQLISRLRIMTQAMRVCEETCTCAVPATSNKSHNDFPLCPMGVSFRAELEIEALGN